MAQASPVETRAVRSARRRAETLEDFNTRFKLYLEDEVRITSTPWHQKLRNATAKLEAHIQGLIKARPQETTFYASVALEFQRQVIARLEAVHEQNEQRGEQKQ